MSDITSIKAIVDLARRQYSMVERRDLVFLVRIALVAEEITGSRAAELLGLSALEMRALAVVWVGRDK